MKTNSVVQKMILTCATVILIIVQLFAQKSVPKGYFGLEWGSSVEEVEEKYPDLKYAKGIKDDTFTGANIYSSFNPPRGSGKVIKVSAFEPIKGVKVRWFVFWKGKLAKVGLLYEDTSKAFPILRQLVALYGPASDQDLPDWKSDVIVTTAYWSDNAVTQVIHATVIDKKNKENSSLTLGFTSELILQAYNSEVAKSSR